jgi:branched-chain amino acid transport system ATP-binding protein
VPEPGPAPPGLEIDSLTGAYGAARVLDDVTISAPPGTITAVLGANGAGKTTLLRAVSGLVRPRRGSIRLGDVELTVLPVEAVARLGIAHVPEGGGVIRELTVEDNLRLGGLQQRDGAARRAMIDGVCDLFPALAARRRQPAFTLSGGERQMLAIGRALGAEPRVLLLDEPSLGLAPLVVADLMALLRRLRDERHLAVVLVEQNARSALSVADAAVVLNLGRVVSSDAAAAIAGDERLRHAYLGF